MAQLWNLSHKPIRRNKPATTTWNTRHCDWWRDWWGGEVGARVSQALTSSLGFQRELESNRGAEGEREKLGGRERQHRLMWLSHAMHTPGTLGWGRGKIRKKLVFWELMQKTSETQCSVSELPPVPFCLAGWWGGFCARKLLSALLSLLAVRPLVLLWSVSGLTH